MTPSGTGAATRDVVGVYGKIPAQGDFVRIHAADPAAQALDVWIQESLEALSRANAELPREPVYFMHQGAGQGALVGVLMRSADRVGRVYPLAVFARVDPSTLGGAYSGFPTAYSLFLQDAARLAADLDRVDAGLLAARARCGCRLPPRSRRPRWSVSTCST
jgi:type VI secretion system protein ImpM